MPSSEETVQLAHGSGGRLSRRLVEEVVLPCLRNDRLAPLEDCAFLGKADGPLAFTTDAFVVDPLFFPGGDIGRLAVCGTVNDLAAGGAQALALSAGFILEEGLPFDVLRRVLQGMRAAADEAGVPVVAGDTKVVPRGKADRVFVTSSGIGVCRLDPPPSPRLIRPGDAVLVSGSLGDHGVTVMAGRNGLTLPDTVRSDCAPLFPLVQALLDAHVPVRALRDPTRGGLAAVLNEMAEAAGVGLEVLEEAVPVREGVAAACEIFGFDPLHLANEGKMVAFVPPAQAPAALAAWRALPLGREAAIVGHVTPGPPGRVVLRTSTGGGRLLDMPVGEILPRIC